MIDASLVLVGALLTISGPAQDQREMVWEGYLYRSAEGRVELGWPVIAMGVMAMPAHVIEGEGAERLAPLVSEVDDQWVFWNTAVPRLGEEKPPEVPLALVRLRGRVRYEDSDEGAFSSGGVRRMIDPVLLNVEFVSRKWLAAWAPWFVEQPQAMRILPGEGEVGYEREFAPKALRALRAMCAVPGPSGEQVTQVRAIAPDARVVKRFRRSMEIQILRWLVAMNRKLSLGLEGLEEEFGAVPPSSVELHRWFLQSPTREAFLTRVAAEWSGARDILQLPYYVADEHSTTYATASVLQVEREWSDEDYALHRATTKKTLGR